MILSGFKQLFGLNLMDNNIHKYFILFLRIGIGLIFLYSGITKILDFEFFLTALKNFHLIPSKLLVFLGILFIVSELILAIMFLLGVKLEEASYFLIILLLLFTSVLAVKIFEGENISCGCFGATESTINYTDIIRNSILILIVLIIRIDTLRKAKKIKKLFAAKSTFFTDIRYFVFVFLFFSLTLQTYVFAIQNAGLKKRLEMILKNKNVIASGDTLKTLSVFNLVGKEEEIKFENVKNEKTLLFIFKTSCKPCVENLAKWNKITELINKEKTAVMGIGIDKLYNLNQLKETSDIFFTFFYNSTEEFRIEHAFFSTPLTILVDNEYKKIIGVWRGLLKEKEIKEVINLSNN
jgi:uncharacterized membrane protein YphA (DoxX/SURF4 family)/peroxiredoxin